MKAIVDTFATSNGLDVKSNEGVDFFMKLFEVLLAELLKDAYTFNLYFHIQSIGFVFDAAVDNGNFSINQGLREF